MEWSNTMVINLIDLYRANECLWNPADNNYKNRLKKLDAWNVIANDLNCDVAEVKKKMESLLGSFRRERQKQESKTGMGADEKYDSTWFAFKSMTFLMDKFLAKKKIDTEDLEEQSSLPEPEQPTEGPNDAVDDTTDEERFAPSTSQKRAAVFSSSMGKKKVQLQTSRAEEAYKILKDTVEKRHYRDPSAIYGDHVASKHRTYSKHTRGVVEHLIGNILFNADMGYYDQKPYHATVSSLSKATGVQSPSPCSNESQSSYSSVGQNNFYSNDTSILSPLHSDPSPTPPPSNVFTPTYQPLLSVKQKVSQRPSPQSDRYSFESQNSSKEQNNFASNTICHTSSLQSQLQSSKYLHSDVSHMSDIQNNFCDTLIQSPLTSPRPDTSNTPAITEYINTFSG